MKTLTTPLPNRFASIPLLAAILAISLTAQGCTTHTAQQSPAPVTTTADTTRLNELDTFWATISKAVNTGDFATYQATCHHQGILVATAGSKKTSQPLAQALARWKKEFDATKAGTMQASVTFRFTRRVGDPTTAHETGIFLYTQTSEENDPIHEYIHFECLLIKENGRWKTIMEYQKAKAIKSEWDQLK